MLNIIRYLEEADQKLCPLISLEVSCGMLTHEQIRMFPSRYERLSCAKILRFVGDNPNHRVTSPINFKRVRLNILIYSMIDHGYTLREIAGFLRQSEMIMIRQELAYLNEDLKYRKAYNRRIDKLELNRIIGTRRPLIHDSKFFSLE